VKPNHIYILASGKSNGVLLVSAKIEIKNKIKIGSKGIIYQTDCWFSIIAVKLKEPANKITIIIAVLKINSYEIILAVDRRLPRKAYLELADQPANNTPYIPKDDSATVYNNPIEKSDKAKPSPKGITPQPKRLKIKVNIGAK